MKFLTFFHLNFYYIVLSQFLILFNEENAICWGLGLLKLVFHFIDILLKLNIRGTIKMACLPKKKAIRDSTNGKRIIPWSSASPTFLAINFDFHVKYALSKTTDAEQPYPNGSPVL